MMQQTKSMLTELKLSTIPPITSADTWNSYDPIAHGRLTYDYYSFP